MSGFLGEDDSIPCKVVVNQELQYSIWPAEKENPLGWADEGFRGARRDCLRHVEVIWQDMCPKPLQKKI